MFDIDTSSKAVVLNFCLLPLANAIARSAIQLLLTDSPTQDSALFLKFTLLVKLSVYLSLSLWFW
ncbi:hypothetical protein [Moorena sp. SIO4G3]|uniref:hypothetical protein n=1 Tax=Moorena sp. SIO4G3 TaxID=2607821 RepID=UPI0014295D06|nr:hypothetical protein [Moorena sp. SIO4G3]NEO75485.1 hypothetical protein [Moorena sp. SIO4G3]